MKISHINVVMDLVLNLIFYVQLNNHVQLTILDVGTMNAFQVSVYVKNYLKMLIFVKQILHIDVLMVLALINHLIVQLKLFVQLIDQLNVMMELVSNQIINAPLKLHVLQVKKDVQMDLVKIYNIIVEHQLPVQLINHINVSIILVEVTQSIVLQFLNVLLWLQFYVLMELALH